jgi:Tfp pilus assembly protein PilO
MSAGTLGLGRNGGRNGGRDGGLFDVRARTPLLAAVLLVWLAVNLAATFLVNIPRAERVSTLTSASDLFRTKLAERRAKVGGLRKHFNRVVDGERSLKTFYDDVLSTKRQRMTAVQKEIRSIATRFNIKPESISYARTFFKNDNIVKFAATLPLAGSYENLRAFISALEASENFLVIESVALADSKEGGVILSLQIEVATYFFDNDVRPGEMPGGSELTG